MNKLLNNKHGKVFLHSKSSGNFTTCTYRLLWKTKSVVVYEPGWHYWDSTLLAPRLSQGSDNVGHPNESLAGEKAYLWWVTECTYRARTRIYGGSHKFNTIGEIRCCQELVLFLTYFQFWTYFAVDSSSVQWLVIPYCDQWDGIHCCLSTYPFATESENEPYTTCVMSIRILKLSPCSSWLSLHAKGIRTAWAEAAKWPLHSMQKR